MNIFSVTVIFSESAFNFLNLERFGSRIFSVKNIRQDSRINFSRRSPIIFILMCGFNRTHKKIFYAAAFKNIKTVKKRHIKYLPNLPLVLLDIFRRNIYDIRIRRIVRGIKTLCCKKSSVRLGKRNYTHRTAGSVPYNGKFFSVQIIKIAGILLFRSNKHKLFAFVFKRRNSVTFCKRIYFLFLRLHNKPAYKSERKGIFCGCSKQSSNPRRW